jgi:multidrug resistance efflux pump
LGALAIAGIGAWLWRAKLTNEQAAGGKAAVPIRTSSVGSGKVSRTLRLSGTSGPEKFVTILGPQMRGSRSFMGGGGAFMGRGSRGGGGGDRGGTSVASTGGSSGGGGSDSSSRSSSSSSSAGSTSSSSASMGGTGGAGGGGSMASMGGQSGGASVGGVRTSTSAFRSSTSRERSSSSRGSSGGSSGRSSTSMASAVMGSEGLGSTSGELYGGGGSSRGPSGSSSSSMMGDFGSILQELIKPGTHVKKGDKVAEFDRQYMLQRLDDYKSGVAQQELNYSRMEADLLVSRKSHDQSILVAKSDVEKAKLDLKTVPVRSDIDAERFRLALEESEARYKQVLLEVPHVRIGEESQRRIAQMDLQDSKLELRRAEANAERMIVRSPIDGMVVMLNIMRGTEFAAVQAGDPIPAGMPYMQIVDPGSMIVNAVVNQVDVEQLRVGAKAKIRFDAFPDLEIPGHVYSVAAMPKSSMSSARGSYLKEIPVRIKMDKMDPRIIPDLSVSVDVLISEEEASAVTTLSSVFRDAQDGKSYVYVRGAKGWQRREVELGLANNSMVAVRSGLRPGEVVAEEKPPRQAPAAASS